MEMAMIRSCATGLALFLWSLFIVTPPSLAASGNPAQGQRIFGACADVSFFEAG
jgi:hypothetical protein